MISYKLNIDESNCVDDALYDEMFEQRRNLKHLLFVLHNCSICNVDFTFTIGEKYVAHVHCLAVACETCGTMLAGGDDFFNLVRAISSATMLEARHAGGLFTGCCCFNEIVELSRRYVDDWLEGERRLYWKLTSGLGQSRPLLAKGKPFPPTLTLALENLYSALHQLETWLLGGFSANCSVNVLHEMINHDLNNIMRQQNALDQDWKLLYPSCSEKIMWMENNWRKYSCYGQLGVDETRCSIFTYLSRLERQCPLIWRQQVQLAGDDIRPLLLPNISHLHASMDDNAQNYKWMKERMTSTWSDWSEAYSWLKRNRRHLLPKKQLTILVHMGFLTKASGFKFGESAFTGGPLGELVQWSDLITTLHFFGHRLLISSESSTLKSTLSQYSSSSSFCGALTGDEPDLIFTDIIGINQIRRISANFYSKYTCRLRVLDSFGTQAQFNHAPYFKAHIAQLGKDNPWGGHTHSPDNSFLGFVVKRQKDVKPRVERKNITLLYGKNAYWNDFTKILDSIKDLVEIHATVNPDDQHLLPSYVVNHGVLDSGRFNLLNREAKIFLGLGFPYEGPAPLEAVANGLVFINPKFSAPRSRLNETFFAKKPTLRQLKSQNSYMEDYIGEPYVFTVDISDRPALRAAVKQALQAEVARIVCKISILICTFGWFEPHVPWEFTAEGMLERVAYYFLHQDFCEPDHLPLNISQLRIYVGESGASCSDTCSKHGFFCEPSFFSLINVRSVIARVCYSGRLACAVIFSECLLFARKSTSAELRFRLQSGHTTYLPMQKLSTRAGCLVQSFCWSLLRISHIPVAVPFLQTTDDNLLAFHFPLTFAPAANSNSMINELFKEKTYIIHPVVYLFCIKSTSQLHPDTIVDDTTGRSTKEKNKQTNKPPIYYWV
ncbi:Alpha-1,6-mannosylglycoprotein 6-beta-N-acetylglucosaminyltransferase A [Trichinella spiralis]|uniref:alpha-1,6-mannosyl-glycoprotein 6-beta-N-acetylglucosaminyltransferase n=1 Tax=Trichinella spiralis TaxID=6334 RepID=A0A0V1B470_TRISP|nr:Alpha-1,6-mannosylglycoprotein 6-beta-N-acetylglucosaminyltransferase A [Trichinella spiralis]